MQGLVGRAGGISSAAPHTTTLTTLVDCSLSTIQECQLPTHPTCQSAALLLLVPLPTLLSTAASWANSTSFSSWMLTPSVCTGREAGGSGCHQILMPCIMLSWQYPAIETQQRAHLPSSPVSSVPPSSASLPLAPASHALPHARAQGGSEPRAQARRGPPGRLQGPAQRCQACGSYQRRQALSGMG